MKSAMKSAVLLPFCVGILFIGTWDIAIRWSGSQIFPSTIDVVRGLPSLRVSPEGLITFDINNDSRTDLLLVGRKGLRFFRQQDDGQIIPNELPKLLVKNSESHCKSDLVIDSKISST